MVEPLEKITKIALGVLEIGGCRYYSVPKAAQLAGVTRNTMFRWLKEGRAKSHTSGIPDIPIEAYRDTFSGHYYITQKTVDKLVNRLILVEIDESKPSI